MTNMHRQAFARWGALQALGNRYSWWLGKRSAPLRFVIDSTGWRLSRVAYQLVGRPKATLSWPLGLSYLLLNGEPTKLTAQARWVDHGLSQILLTDQVQSGLHIDMGGLGYAALALESGYGYQRGYLEQARSMGDRYLSRTGAGAGLITYAEHRSEVLVDTLAMLCPFLARLSRLTGDSRYLETAMAQLNSFMRYAENAETGWVTHGFDTKTLTPLAPPGWGRGIGWQLLGLADTLMEIDDPTMREPLERACKALLIKLANVQLANGHWPWLLTDTTQQSDSSVTALLCYGLGRLLSQEGDASSPFTEFVPLLKQGRAALDSSTTETGMVDDCSGEAAGVGNYSRQFGCYLWSLAPTVALDAISLATST
jgi:unsaturated rhamnogalacturonyl hydrolase